VFFTYGRLVGFQAGFMKVGVVGLGYIGLVWAAVLATRGFEVVGVDIDEGKVRAVSSGRVPFYEPRLSEMVSAALGEGLLRATTRYEELRDAEAVFILVGTPPGPRGCADVSAVYDAARRVGEAWRGVGGERLLVVRSTVPPGTTRRAGVIASEASGLRLGSRLLLAFNPEFTREGSAVADMLRPSRVVIGEYNRASGDALEGLYRVLYGGGLPPVIRTSLENAELAKYASNVFLAARVSLINALALIAGRLEGGDIDAIATILGLDPRIGREYLRAGLGFGGSCLPKDLAALTCLAEEMGLEAVAGLLRSVWRVNEAMVEHAAGLLEEALGGLRGRTVAVLGLAFKPGTDDTRESRSLRLVELLVERGAYVKAHDPVARPRLPEGAVLVDSVEEALRGANAAVVATPWQEYVALTPGTYARLLSEPRVVLDPWRVYTPAAFKRAGVRLVQVGVRLE